MPGWPVFGGPAFEPVKVPTPDWSGVRLSNQCLKRSVHTPILAVPADGYDLGANQSYDNSDAVLELSPRMHLESIFYPKDWKKLSADDLDLGMGDPVLVGGFVFQIGKTDIAYLLRQGHLGGEEGEVASLSMCSGDPDGGHAVEGSVIYVPCPNGVTAVKVLARPPYLKRLWTDNDGVAGGPIIADGLVWTIGSKAVHGLNPASGDKVVSIPFGGMQTTSRRRRSVMACCSFPVRTRSSPSWVPLDCPRPFPSTSDGIGPRTSASVLSLRTGRTDARRQRSF